MQLLAVELTDFRNVASALLEPHPRFNVFAGENGQGKTNLLEALFLVGTLRSFRATRLEELVRFGQPSTRVRARVRRRDLDRLYEVEVSAGVPARKVSRVDGKGVRAADYFGGFNVVLFAPDDLRLPRGSPAGRRRFLDRAVWNAEPAFLDEAQGYERVLRSRNALLRDGRPPPDLLAVYDQQLAAAGAAVVARRRRYLERLAPLVAETYARFTGSGLPVEARYLTRLDEDPAAPPAPLDAGDRRAGAAPPGPLAAHDAPAGGVPGPLAERDVRPGGAPPGPFAEHDEHAAGAPSDALAEHDARAGGTSGPLAERDPPAGALAARMLAGLGRSRGRDLAQGYTTFGPHTDDLELLLDGRPARLYASQGQLRALVLALKVAEIQLLERLLDDTPILLLDDVSSELDSTRNELLFQYLAEVRCQVFITTTDPGHVKLGSERLDHRVEGGFIRAAVR